MTPVGQMVIELIESGQLDNDLVAIEQAIRNTGQVPQAQFRKYAGRIKDATGGEVQVFVGDRVSVTPLINPKYLRRATGTISAQVRSGRSLEIRLDEPWHTQSAKLRGSSSWLRFKKEHLTKI